MSAFHAREWGEEEDDDKMRHHSIKPPSLLYKKFTLQGFVFFLSTFETTTRLYVLL